MPTDLKEAAADYQRDGAVALRGVLSPEWVAQMRAAIDGYDPEDRWNTVWMSRRSNEFAAFVRESGLAELAGGILAASRIRFFYDQLFVKEAGRSDPTPLHQDLPYWPIAGERVLSVWVPFDSVRAENSVVQYLRGSHLWGQMYEPASFVPGRERSTQETGEYERIEDPAGLVRKSEVLCWELEPGDVLVHHPLTLHFSTPNLVPGATRRAIALRYAAEGTSFLARPGHFMQRQELPAHWPQGPIVLGAELSGPDYPEVWSAAT